MAFDGPNGQLLFVRSPWDQGSFWPTPTVVDSVPSGLRYNYLTLLVVNGKPVIVGQRANADVIAIWAKDSDGTVWDIPEVVGSIGNVGQGCSAATDGTTVAIAYMDPTGQREHIAYK